MTGSAPSDLILPSFHSAPTYDWTEGPLVADLLAMCSDDKGPFVLDPEQRLVIDDWFGYVRTPAGPRLASFEGAVVAARQNMKTGVLKAAALGKIYVSEQRLVVWSSHEAFAASEAYRDIKTLIESNDDLMAEVLGGDAGFHGALGREFIEFTGDRRLIFKSRTGTSGRSLSGDAVILDEAFALQSEHMASLAPTLAARPDPQMLYGSSAGLLTSSVLRALRDRGRADGGSPRLAYAEWCAEQRPCAEPDCDHTLGTEGCALDDEELIRQANTAIARGRMTVQTVRGLRSALAGEPLKFARECLGWWDDPGDDRAESPLDAATFEGLRNVKSRLVDEQPVFALDVAPRRKWSGIVAAGRNGDGLVHVEVPSRRGEFAYWRGTARIAPTFRRLRKRFPGARVRMLEKGQAVPFAAKLVELGYEVELVSPGAYLPMCTGLVDAVEGGEVTHLGEAQLVDAVRSAGAVDIGEEQWRWSRRKSGGDVSLLVAMTLAVDAVKNESAAFNVW